MPVPLLFRLPFVADSCEHFAIVVPLLFTGCPSVNKWNCHLPNKMVGVGENQPVAGPTQRYPEDILP